MQQTVPASSSLAIHMCSREYNSAVQAELRLRSASGASSGVICAL